MIEEVLKNLVYLIYPKNICAYTEKEKYFSCEEYKRLNKIISDFEIGNGKIFRKDILKEFEEDYTLKAFQDLSLLDGGDRCMTFNITIIENGELYTISLFMSVIIPYYVVKVQKNIIELWFSKERIAELEEENMETRKLKELVFEIETIIENKFLYNKFPDNFIDFVISDISFEDSMFGHFTLYNAFFNNVTIRAKNEN
ncbi:MULTISPECIES: hypothetical protein [Flavobacterium]|uniref:Uncharacterized protein n=1 Tax=Flavobacterium ginsengisoli TaxID=871694 RepID=A0ABP7FP09_9FLAO|nr:MULTISPECIES: hypothetical protein [Flavobacterium]MBJ2124534.1 hypothetical protein [Flavobacterium sp. IB48]